MRLRWRLRTLMVAVMIAALASSLIMQTRRANRLESALQAERALTASQQAALRKEMRVVIDKLEAARTRDFAEAMQRLGQEKAASNPPPVSPDDPRAGSPP